MGRKSTQKVSLTTRQKINTIQNNHDSDNFYRKRLRSWKEPSTETKDNTPTKEQMMPSHRSTIFTYPIRLNADRQSIPSSTILSESSTMESAFYRPSTSIEIINDVNNNHLSTVNVENRKRKTSSSSCESLSSQVSQKIMDEKNTNSALHMTHYENPTKRLRATTNDSLITNHSPLFIDSDTIDINQLDPQEPLSSTINNESIINNSTSMEAAVKMVQPIVDIIFHAFEDQLKHIQTKSIPPPSLPNTSPIVAPFCSPLIMPYFPLSSPARPIVLHAVNFNIELSRKQSDSNAQLLTNDNLSEKDNSRLTSFTDLQERLASYIQSNTFMSEYHHGRPHVKRIVQLAVVGLSALCGYWLL